jgi:hypothetical protein
MESVSSKVLAELFNHGSRWLSNLSRAKSARKQQSVQALRKVITASRQTAVYIRQLNDTAQVDHKTERELAVLWTDLGFALEDLELNKLAKRCQITGKHWSDPKHYDEDFLYKADISLDKMEKMAKLVLLDINR